MACHSKLLPMKATKTVTIILFFTLFRITVYSQSAKTTGWFFLSHSQKISKKFKALADVQVRSTNKLVHVETLLLRGGVGYKVNDNSSVTIGYTYKGDWATKNGKSVDRNENRIYEQYTFGTNIKRTELTFRFRQEQRFIKDTGNYKFSQRSRVFLSFQVPIIANTDFSKGLYSTIQDELFVNTQHKENVNNSFFDQNRAFISIGYRWNKKIDTEIGYMRWVKKETEGSIFTNVCQVMITTQL